MLWPTHILFAVGIASFFTADPVMLAVAAFFGLFPDLDYFIKHRAWFSHSLLSTSVLVLVVLLASGSSQLAFISGISLLGHLLLDLMTKSGVLLFFPVYKRSVGIRFIKSKNPYINGGILLGSVIVAAINLTLNYTEFIVRTKDLLGLL